MANKACPALFAVLTAIALAGCGGSDHAAPAACQTQPALPVLKISYPNDSVRVGANVTLTPTIDVSTNGGFGGAILRFDLVAGPLPSGLTLDPTTGRISGRVGGPSGSYSFSVRVSADCFAGSVTTSASITVG